MISDLLVSAVGGVISLFVFWRRLKEDYDKEQIFATVFFVLGGLFLGQIIAVWFLPIFWFWLVLAGEFLGLTLAIWRFRLHFYETLEAGVAAQLPWLTLVFLNEAIKKADFISFIGFCVLSGLIAIFHFADIHYKSFTWYRSGRIGIAGLLTLVIFFTLRMALAYFNAPVLSFAGSSEKFLSLIALLAFGLMAAFLARQKK